MQNKLTKLLNIKYPIIQGAMAWISESTLVSSLCNAGATGVIATGGRDISFVRDEIRRTKELTDKPFGVNIMLMADNKDDIIKLCCEEKVSFVTLGAGNPVPYFEILKENNIKIIPVVPNLKLAKRVEQKGADAIILEGMEAGGHIGNQTTMALLENVIPNINIPVVIAGGIVDGRGLASALLMGASGVQMGSRFLLSSSCLVHQNSKDMIINATDTDSVVTGYSRNHGVRGLKNDFTDKFLELEISGAKNEELFKLATGTNRKAAVDGDTKDGLVQVGQSLVPLNKIQTTKEIIDEIINEAIEKLDNASKLSSYLK
ncbi:nitronate monooxygenase [Peptostreptococcaceae bacterium AGR-M142]